MTDLSIEMDTHQLERVIEKLESYDPNVDGNNFYVNMGSKAKDELPVMISKLKSLLNVSNQINLVSGRIQNTTRIVISGSTMNTLSKLLDRIGSNDS